jgi:effector-binding domain-containing protein
MATEEAPYTVIKTDDIFELREYAPQVLAEIIVEGELEDAGNKAFRPLFRYISGDNKSRGKIAMTAPVSQEQKGEKISMTAPVSQQRVQGKWAVSFMMPASYTMETLPTPDDPNIKLRQVPARRVAAVRYSGFWSEEKYLFHREKLEKWIKDNRFTVTGEAVWARYNPPFTPWFMRRNEILIPVTAGDK